MAQKYSILSTGRASSTRYKAQFGSLQEGGGGCEGYTNEGEEQVSLWHLRGYSWHFHDSSDSRRRSEKKRDARDGAHFYEVLRTRRRAVNTICEPEAATSLLTVASSLFLTPHFLSPDRVRAIRKFACVRSRYWRQSRVSGNYSR